MHSTTEVSYGWNEPGMRPRNAITAMKLDHYPFSPILRLEFAVNTVAYSMWIMNVVYIQMGNFTPSESAWFDSLNIGVNSPIWIAVTIQEAIRIVLTRLDSWCKRKPILILCLLWASSCPDDTYVPPRQLLFTDVTHDLWNSAKRDWLMKSLKSPEA